MTNNNQQLAIDKTEGPCVILAGAGTGKSFTVIEKIKKLVNEDIYKPEEILCLTFSNEATNSLKQDVAEKIKTNEDVTVKTFHAFCFDILKEDGHLIGIDESSQLLLPDDAKILMYKYLNIDPYWSNRYISSILSAKDFGITLEQLKENVKELETKAKELSNKEDIEAYAKEERIKLNLLHLNPKDTVDERRDTKNEKKQIGIFLKAYDEYEKNKKFVDAFERYEEFKKERKLLDYSDLNKFVLELFEQFGSDKYIELFKYVFVDEFQDTNKLQFSLIEYIAKHHNITVVGDPNQSIYGFRGAYKESFNHFKEVFNIADEDIIKLDLTYRSPNNVLKISHDLIKNNYENQEDCIFIKNAEERDGDKVKVIELVNAEEEAIYISTEVEKAIKNKVPMNEICILCRTHAQSNIIKQALDSKNIKHISAGRINLMQKREIRIITSYLGILSNLIKRTGTGDQSWWDLFHYQNTLSVEDSVKIGRYLKKHRDEELGIDELLLNSIDALELSDKSKEIINNVINKLKELVKISNKPLPELILDVVELSGLNRAFSYERSIENIEALMNIKRFYEVAKNYYEMHEQTLEGFIDYLEIIDNLGVNVDASKIMHIDAVRVMTIHASKGLGFELVICSNLAKGRFPVTRTQNEPLIPKHLIPDLKRNIKEWDKLDEKEIDKQVKQYEKDILEIEERRLAYVAWTRTKTNLVLTYAKSYNEKPDSSIHSSFLNEINYTENEYCEFIKNEDENHSVIAKQSEYEKYKTLLKEQLVNSLDTDQFEDIVKRCIDYVTCRDNKLDNFKEKLKSIEVSDSDLKKQLKKEDTKQPILKFTKESYTFSPSSIMTYMECPKKFELKNLFQMPERGQFDKDGSGALTGSFVHLICELGVNEKFTSLKEYTDLAEKKIVEAEWKKVDIEVVKELLEVFYERNSHKIDENSKTELKLPVEIDGFKFYGLADRIDTLEDGCVEIIDYKTNKKAIDKDKREIQLGFYALALQKLGYKVSRLTLDMLKLEKPVEFGIDSDGNVTSLNGREKGFTLEEVKSKIIELAKSIAKDYENGFNCAEDEKSCRFCGYKFYCPKWDE